MFFLLDINVLIARADESHVFHSAVLKWLHANQGISWASCPITENGFMRIFGHQNYQGGPGSPDEARFYLEAYCRKGRHRFLPADVSLLDTSLFMDIKNVKSSQLTDVYLIGLAVRHGGRFATFGGSIRASHVHGGAKALEVITVK